MDATTNLTDATTNLTDATTNLTGATEARNARKASEAYRSSECALRGVSYLQLLLLQCYYTQLAMFFDYTE